MKILFLHGWNSLPGGGVEPGFPIEQGHEVRNPALIEVGNDHRLADPGPLCEMLQACQRLAK